MIDPHSVVVLKVRTDDDGGAGLKEIGALDTGIPTTLLRTGYTHARYVSPFESVQLKGVDVNTIPEYGAYVPDPHSEII